MAKKEKVSCHFIDSYLCPFSNGRLRVYVFMINGLKSKNINIYWRYIWLGMKANMMNLGY